MTTGLYAAIAAVLLIYLSFRVIGLRRSERVSIGHQGNEALERAMRVQANFTEYAPIALVLLLIVETNGLPQVFVHLGGAAFLLARVVHFAGFRSAQAPGLYRRLGAAGTFVVIGLLAIVAGAQSFAFG